MHPEIIQDSICDEPKVICPVCGKFAFANWVSVYKDPYEIQVEPFHCACGWTEECPNANDCAGTKCKSYHLCYPAGGHK